MTIIDAYVTNLSPRSHDIPGNMAAYLRHQMVYGGIEIADVVPQDLARVQIPLTEIDDEPVNYIVVHCNRDGRLYPYFATETVLDDQTAAFDLTPDPFGFCSLNGIDLTVISGALTRSSAAVFGGMIDIPSGQLDRVKSCTRYDGNSTVAVLATATVRQQGLTTKAAEKWAIYAFTTFAGTDQLDVILASISDLLSQSSYQLTGVDYDVLSYDAIYIIPGGKLPTSAPGAVLLTSVNYTFISRIVVDYDTLNGYAVSAADLRKYVVGVGNSRQMVFLPATATSQVFYTRFTVDPRTGYVAFLLTVDGVTTDLTSSLCVGTNVKTFDSETMQQRIGEDLSLLTGAVALGGSIAAIPATGGLSAGAIVGILAGSSSVANGALSISARGSRTTPPTPAKNPVSSIVQLPFNEEDGTPPATPFWTGAVGLVKFVRMNDLTGGQFSETLDQSGYLYDPPLQWRGYPLAPSGYNYDVYAFANAYIDRREVRPDYADEIERRLDEGVRVWHDTNDEYRYLTTTERVTVS